MKITKTNLATEIKLPEIGLLTEEFVGKLLNDLRSEEIPEIAAVEYTFRTRRQATAWFACYVRTEAQGLNEEFVSSEKYYDYALTQDQDKKWLRFSFRLRTRGLEGSTEYGIEVRKDGEYFACLE